MARDTRGPVPYGHSDLRRVSLNPLHWREARRMLGGEALTASMIGVAGLLGVYLAHPRGTGVSAVGLDLTPAFSWTVLTVGIAAAVATLHRRLAMVFCAVVGAVSLPMVIVSAVAATHHAPGPLGFTVGATVLYAAFFCANLAIGMWLVPDRLEGPAWRHTERRSSDGRNESRGHRT